MRRRTSLSPGPNESSDNSYPALAMMSSGEGLFCSYRLPARDAGWRFGSHVLDDKASAPDSANNAWQPGFSKLAADLTNEHIDNLIPVHPCRRRVG